MSLLSEEYTRPPPFSPEYSQPMLGAARGGDYELQFSSPIAYTSQEWSNAVDDRKKRKYQNLVQFVSFVGLNVFFLVVWAITPHGNGTFWFLYPLCITATCFHCGSSSGIWSWVSYVFFNVSFFLAWFLKEEAGHRTFPWFMYMLGLSTVWMAHHYVKYLGTWGFRTLYFVILSILFILTWYFSGRSATMWFVYPIGVLACCLFVPLARLVLGKKEQEATPVTETSVFDAYRTSVGSDFSGSAYQEPKGPLVPSFYRNSYRGSTGSVSSLSGVWKQQQQGFEVAHHEDQV